MKVVKSDLDNSIILISILEAEIIDANKISAQISDFTSIISMRTSFQGPGYNSIKNKLEDYKTLMNKRKETAIILKEALRKALDQMNSYMGNISEYDDSEIDELETTVASLKTQLYKEIKVDDEETKELYRRYNQQTIDLINTLEPLIDKLKQLAPTDNEAYQIISNTSVNIQNYNQLINNIKEIDTTNLPTFSNNYLSESNNSV